MIADSGRVGGGIFKEETVFLQDTRTEKIRLFWHYFREKEY
jgi:hypothetical protein